MKTHWLICALMLLCLLPTLVMAAEAPAGPPAVEVHGWMLTRFYSDITVDDTRDSSGVITNEEDDSRLRWERVSLSGLARLANGKQAYGEIYIHPWLPNSDPSFLYLESLYLDVPAGPGAKFRIGKGRSVAFGIVPAYGARKTSNYGPLEEAFTQDRVLGVQYLQTRGRDSLAFGVLNGQRPGTRAIGMAADMQLDHGSLARTTVAHLTDRDAPQDRSGTLGFSARYGRQLSAATNAGISVRASSMEGTDRAFLKKRFATYNGTNETMRRYGVDATYSRMPYYGTAQYYAGDTGGIRSSGWEVLLGVEPSAKCTGIWRELSPACKGLFVRYGKLKIDVPKTLDSITWDTDQLALSYVYPLRVKRYGALPKWLQIEYERNHEHPPAGASQIPNNVFFVELFSAF